MVDADDSVESHVVIPSGEKWEVTRFIGNAAYDPHARVCLVWDYGTPNAQPLRSTHGDIELDVAHQLTGDGSKKLAIVLTNDTQSQQSMGGGFEAKVLP